MTAGYHTASADRGPLFMGCPVWACPEWRGNLFPQKSPRTQWLTEYSRVFNTVEGNSTFYGLPSLDTFRRWADSVEPGFQFALKFPRAISHDARLLNAERTTGEFLERLAILNSSGCLGPSFLQLGPDFSPAEFDALACYIEQLPKQFPFAVEVRHFGFFDSDRNETAVVNLLREHQVDWTIFDSRPLYSQPPVTETEVKSQGRKPKTPLRKTVTGSRPMLRLVGRDRIEDVDPWLDEWAPVIADWIEAQLRPFVFTHAPDDTFAPLIAERLHARVAQQLSARTEAADLPALPAWPGRIEANRPKQMSLF